MGKNDDEHMSEGAAFWGGGERQKKQNQWAETEALVDPFEGRKKGKILHEKKFSS